MTFWTDERKATAERLYREGWSSSQIAREVGAVSRNAVLGMLHRKKIARSRPSEPARPKPRSAWTDMSPPEKLRVIRDGLAQGLSAKAIAASVGVSAQIVTSYGNKHGLRFLPAELAAERRRIGSSTIQARLVGNREPRPLSKYTPRPTGELPAKRLLLADVGPADCRYINGDPRGDHSYCDQPKRSGSSYCDHHHRLCYFPRVQPCASA